MQKWRRQCWRQNARQPSPERQETSFRATFPHPPRALKVRLVRILEVSEGGVQVTPQPMVKSRMMVAAMAESTPVSAGQVGVNASVTIRWEIAPCPAQGACE